MRGHMATTKSKATAAKAPVKRAKSKLSQTGDAAKLAAERELLRSTLVAHDWNATAAGRALGIDATATALRQIERCGLRAEYEKHGR